MKTYTAEQLKELLDLHRKWLRDDEGGQCANLSYANLSYANLSDANLSDANLSYANLSDANLSDANLSDANLSYANLSYANLSGANLSGANLRRAKEDVLKIISITPNEIPGLLDALKNGRVDGSVYEGECACLVGTIANVRKCNYTELKGIEPDSRRPAERLFLAIKRGDTPENNPISKLVVEWIEEWQAENDEEVVAV
ncbi:pentapeptide repeat-containing protein [Paenibacillus oryzisoli]|uniref:Pentapeptide repeat-containing protein n=1 Tax=Paenibacillus oryzisoli TaxID=1850517 RepID=A0A198AEB4_9BACL|nr:pentapeptide repeat-containing protein [Paenibacillus oryzisoli]OAS19283.1 hypothetical protein A8708_26600 [Paenibacillus oryzisoli]